MIIINICNVFDLVAFRERFIWWGCRRTALPLPFPSTLASKRAGERVVKPPPHRSLGMHGWLLWSLQLTLAAVTQEKAHHPLLVTSNQCTPIKSILRWSTVTFCACNIIYLLSVVFCVIRAVQKFDFRLVINETSNKWRSVERRSISDRDTFFWHALYVFSRPTPRVLAGFCTLE
jgi:hypothetical protein